MEKEDKRLLIFIVCLMILGVIYLLVDFRALFNPELPVMTGINYTELNYDDIDGEAVLTNEFGDVVVYMNDYFVSESITGNFVVERKEKFGLMSPDGDELVPVECDQIMSFEMGGKISTYTRRGTKYNILTEDFKFIEDEYYDSINMNYLVEMNYRYNDMSEALKSEYQDSIYFSYIVSKDGYLGIVDLYGNVIANTEYEEFEVYDYDTDLIIAKKDGELGLITFDNTIVLDFAYDFISDYLIRVNQNKYGAINNEGEKIINPIYAHIARIHLLNDPYTYYVVKNQSDYYGVIDQWGIVRVPFIYDDINFSDDLEHLEVTKDGRVGTITVDNQIKIPIYYEYLDRYKHFSIMRSNGSFGVVNTDGSLLIMAMYDEINVIYDSASDVYRLDLVLNDNHTEYIIE